MTYGPLTIDRHETYRQKGIRLHVFIDGVDVTSRCEFANDETGVARVLCGDAAHHRDWRLDGPPHVLPDAGELGPHWLEVQGYVEIRP